MWTSRNYQLVLAAQFLGADSRHVMTALLRKANLYSNDCRLQNGSGLRYSWFRLTFHFDMETVVDMSTCHLTSQKGLNRELHSKDPGPECFAV